MLFNYAVRDYTHRDFVSHGDNGLECGSKRARIVPNSWMLLTAIVVAGTVALGADELAEIVEVGQYAPLTKSRCFGRL